MNKTTKATSKNVFMKYIYNNYERLVVMRQIS
jgi:hypothetical protein